MLYNMNSPAMDHVVVLRPRFACVTFQA
jgi:hypothetical protein